jgi:V8-like Glu-specific endopeptidase
LLLDGGANPNVHVDSSGSPVHAHTATSCGRWWNCCGREGDLQTADTAALYRERQVNDVEFS